MSALSVGLERAVEDMDAVMAFVSRQPWADRTRLLGHRLASDGGAPAPRRPTARTTGGMSRGGLLSIVYASTRSTGARGVINFAGGWTVDTCDQRIHFHEQTLAWAGRSASVPMLWLYSENDRNYGPVAIRSYHRAFTGAGGKADLHLFAPIGHDGHILLPRSVSVWAGAVDGYVRRIIGSARPARRRRRACLRAA